MVFQGILRQEFCAFTPHHFFTIYIAAKQNPKKSVSFIILAPFLFFLFFVVFFFFFEGISFVNSEKWGDSRQLPCTEIHRFWDGVNHVDHVNHVNHVDQMENRN